MEYPLTRATVEYLPNGLTLILDPDPSAPVVSVQCWVATGSMHEAQHLGAGISHFLEHMVFKGTRDAPGDVLAERIQAAGGHWNAYTTFDRTVYYIDGPAASLDVFNHALAGMIFFPSLPEADFENEKDVIRREIDMGLDDPESAASRLLFSNAFVRDPRRHPVIGHRARFDGLTYHDLTDYHRQRYLPDRCHWVIAGDFDPREIRQRLMDLTTGATPCGGSEPFIPSDGKLLGPRTMKDAFLISNSKLSVAWKIPDLSDADAPVYDVLAAILGRGKSSRLHRRLRDEKGLALEISAFSWTMTDHEGIFAISAEVNPEQCDQLVESIHREIASLASEDLSADLAKAQRQISVSQLRSLTTASGRASDLASNWHDARDLNFTRKYLLGIRAVSVEDMRRVAKNFVPEQCLMSVLEPMESLQKKSLNSRPSAVSSIDEFTLTNGLNVAIIQDARVPLVHAQIAVKAGLMAESAETNGICQLLASTITKGTTTRSADEIALRFENLGATISAGVGNNAVLVQCGGLSSDLECMLEVLADVLTSPTFPLENMTREKHSQLAAIDEASHDPLHQAIQNARAACFTQQGYGRDLLGNSSSVQNLQREQLVAFHQTHFGAKNMALVIAGDVDSTSLKKRIEKQFRHLPAGEVWSPPPNQFSSGGSINVSLDKKQAVITVAFPGASATSEDRFALSMLHEYAADMAGPLFTRIREELGLAYQVGATQFHGYDAGLFTFYLATSPEQAELALTELLAEIQKIATDGIPEDAFDRARATLLSSLAIQQQSPSSLARHAAVDILFDQPANGIQELPKIYQNLTSNEVRRVAQHTFSKSPTIVRVLPQGEKC